MEPRVRRRKACRRRSGRPRPSEVLQAAAKDALKAPGMRSSVRETPCGIPANSRDLSRPSDSSEAEGAVDEIIVKQEKAKESYVLKARAAEPHASEM